MGLMSWLRGGRSAGGGDAVPDAGPADRGSPDERSERVDVQRIAPMQRTVPEQDLVIDPVGFQGALSTRQPTALSTPLGHLVSPDAPTGVLHGITSPAPGSPVPAVQRSVDMPARRVPGGGKVAPVAVPASVSVPAAVPVQRASSVMTSAGTSAVADLPVRQLVGEQPLLPEPEPGPESEPGPVPGPAQEPPSRRAPGLGAPLAGLPPTAQRQAAASVPGSGTTETSSGPVVRPPVAATAPVAPVAPVVPVVPETSADEVESMQPVVAPLLGDDPSVSTVPGTEPPAAAPPSAPALQRSVVSSTPPRVAAPTVPLLGDRPLTPRTAVQRDARGGAEPPQPQPAPETAPKPVPVRWTTPGQGTSTPPPPAAPAPVQLSVISSTPRPPAPVSASPPVPAALPVQRKAGGGPPVPGSPPRTDTGSAPLPTAGAFAVAAGVAQRMPDGSVVFGSSSAPHASHSPGNSPPVVQRDAELSEEPPPTDSEPETGSEPEPALVDESGAPAPTGTGPAAAPARPGGTPVVTDELVRALYAPLSRLLKADLRLERERAGFLINTRH